MAEPDDPATDLDDGVAAGATADGTATDAAPKDWAAADRAREARSRRRLLAVLVAALLIAVVVGVAGYLGSDLRDPYRAGTSHVVEVTFTLPCIDPHIEVDGDLQWKATGPTPKAWGHATTPGTLEIVAKDGSTYRAVFTADAGGTLAFAGHHGCSDLSCAIA